MSRVALVTGATSDIGAAICAALVRTGHDVVAHGFRRAPDIGGRIVIGDVASLQDVRAIAERIGTVDVLVNVAAHVRFERFMQSDPADWGRQLDVTLLGTMHTCRVFGEGMVERGWGRIVNVAAEGALTGEPALAVATMAKAGVLGLTRTLALELAPRGITVNAVSPGLVPTSALPDALQDEARLQAAAAHYPMKRLGTPRDIAATVAFLASEDAGYVTGQTISVSGGLSVR